MGRVIQGYALGVGDALGYQPYCRVYLDPDEAMAEAVRLNMEQPTQLIRERVRSHIQQHGVDSVVPDEIYHPGFVEDPDAVRVEDVSVHMPEERP